MAGRHWLALRGLVISSGTKNNIPEGETEPSLEMEPSHLVENPLVLITTAAL